MGIFGKLTKNDQQPGTNAEPTKEEKDAWKKDQERKRAEAKTRWNEKHGVVAHHDAPDWPRKAVSKKAFRKNSKRARRFYMEANNG